MELTRRGEPVAVLNRPSGVRAVEAEDADAMGNEPVF